MKQQPIRYINDDPQQGIMIDWEYIHKEFLKIGECKKYPDPLRCDVGQVGYIIDLSDRSRGKTSQKLILGLLLYVAYGIQLHVIRQSKRMTEPKVIKDMYKTVIENHYISEITEGRWNHIFYRGKRWYLCHVDDTGEIDEIDTDHCCICFGLDESDDIKSTYNAPRGDMIYYDEFISTYYGYDDFIRFTDICKTVIRSRKSPIIFMSSNTIDLNTPWFDEFGIRSEVQTMHMGDFKILSTDLGTHIYIEILAAEHSKIRHSVNRRFFGFNNSRLNAISGRGEWATDTYPHIPPYKETEPECVCNRVYLHYQGQYIHLKLMSDPVKGCVVHVTPATKTYDDSIIITADEPTTKNHVFGFCEQTTLQLWWQLYKQNRWLYTSNGLGSTIHSYVGFVRTKTEKMRGY